MAAPCAKHGQCYALKAYRQYPGTRNAWDNNYRLLLADRADGYYKLIEAVEELCFKYSPRYFRIHVAGDFLDQEHLDAWWNIAHMNPYTKFRAFTKNYTLNYENLEENLIIGFSTWPGWEPSDSVSTSWKRLPKAWILDKHNPDDRIPKKVYMCPGSCVKCKHCWNHLTGDVVFRKH